jgi:CDGSH-type Zn-finger protein
MSRRDVVIVPYQDGPYLVRGPVVLRDHDGKDIALNRRTIALCRCGKSRMRPFCDGTHHLIGFRVPSQRETPQGRNSKPAAQSPAANAPRELPRHVAHRKRSTPGRAPASGNGSQPDGGLPQNVRRRSRSEALRSAESLLRAARTHVERYPVENSHDAEILQSDWAEPALCLVTGAIVALSPFGGDDERQISRVVDELTTLVLLLDAGGDRG